MDAPLIRGHLSTFNDLPIYRVNFALPLRGNLFDNVVVVKHEGHCTTNRSATHNDNRSKQALSPTTAGKSALLVLTCGVAKGFRSKEKHPPRLLRWLDQRTAQYRPSVREDLRGFGAETPQSRESSIEWFPRESVSLQRHFA